VIAALGFGATGPALAITAAALSIPATALMRVNGAFANAARRFTLSFFPELFFRPLFFLAAVLAMIWVGLQVSAVTLGLAASLIAFVATGGQWWLLRDVVPRTAAPSHPGRLMRQWRAIARPLLIVGLFSTLFADLSLVMAGLFLPQSELAAFGICIKLAFMVGFAVQIAHQVATPELAASHARREGAAGPRILAQANLLAVAVTFAAVVVCAGLGDRILAIFGPGYADAWPALAVVMASQFVRACFGPNVQLLTITGLQRPMAAVFALSVAVLAATSFLLVPAYGIFGAAVAVALTTLFWALALAFVLYRGSGIRADVLVAY
jgi:O-antigen/teichoic acid export membrane protein